MQIHFDRMEDKVEFFEATNLKTLEAKINEQIDQNRALLLQVHHVSHQMHADENGRTYFTAVVHFKAK